MTNPLTMTPDEREAFLAQLHIAVLSVGRASGPPVTGPSGTPTSPAVRSR
jgi:hypothetical protein